MLNVFLTVDTELWPAVAGWPRHPLPEQKSSFTEAFEACILGQTAQGDYGVPYQIQVLNKHGLKAVYLVEPLFSCVTGKPFLQQVVEMVQQSGHEVGLHPHTEWLGEIKAQGLPGHYGPAIQGYPLAEQQAIIQFALNTLRDAGAHPVVSYRAGSYAANQDTLTALAAAGIRFDTSYNRAYAESFPDLPSTASMDQPTQIGGVWEYPISNFTDFPGHLRHVQLCACSFRELRHLLMQAWRQERQAFVIVLHSFELVRRKLGADSRFHVAPNRMVIRRFQQLCRFLEQHRDKFQTQGFADLAVDAIPAGHRHTHLHSTLWNTGLRQLEQVASRWI